MENNSITIEEIEKGANMSALDFTQEEKLKLIDEVSGIVSMLNECGQVNTEGVSKTEGVALTDLREDNVVPCEDSSELLKSAPLCSNGFVVIPRVVE